MSMSDRARDITEPSDAHEAERSLVRRLGRHGLITFATTVAATGAGFLLAVVLARLMGKAGFGAYRVLMAWVSLAAIPVMGGQRLLLVRELPALARRGHWDRMAGLLRWSDLVAVSASLALAATVLAGLHGLAAYGVIAPVVWADRWSAALAAAAALVLTAVLSLRQAALRGLDRSDLSQSPLFLITPLIMLLITGGWHLFATRSAGDAATPSLLAAPTAVVMYDLALLVALVVAARWCAGALPKELQGAGRCFSARAAWRRAAWPMILAGVMQMLCIRTDIVLLGMLVGDAEAGLYAAASQCAVFVGFVQRAVNTPLAGAVSGLFEAGQTDRLQRVVTRFSRLTFIFSLMATGAMVLLSGLILSLFGAEFRPVRPALIILCAGQALACLAGPAWLLLTMTGQERSTARYSTLGAGMNIALNLLLIPRYGGIGAAIATAVSLAASNLIMALRVMRKVGINPLAVKLR